jgi:hypothetical protein
MQKEGVQREEGGGGERDSGIWEIVDSGYSLLNSEEIP